MAFQARCNSKSQSTGRTSHDCSASTCCTNTSSSHRVRTHSFEPIFRMSLLLYSENWKDTRSHGCILQHIGNYEEANHTATDVNLIELRYAPITTSDCDVLQGYVQIVFRCKATAEFVCQSSVKVNDLDVPSASFPL